nr:MULTISPECIES: prolyl oligopeptidase family serine peptidase [unclassified Caballeronia]
MTYRSRHCDGLLWPKSNDPDAFMGLESLNSLCAQAWVDAQTCRTEVTFGEPADTLALATRLERAYTSQDRIVMCTRHGDWAYNTWQDNEYPLGILRRTAWHAWLAGEPVWETVLDVGAIDLNVSDIEDIHWTLASYTLLHPDHNRALIKFSRGGSDACVVREFDVEANRFIDDGFNIPNVGKHFISWISCDAVYVSWDDSLDDAEDAVTTSGLPRQSRLWTRGTRLADAPVAFEGAKSDMVAVAFYDPAAKLRFAFRNLTFYETLHYWLDETTGCWRQYDLPAHAEIDHWNRWLIVTLRKQWTVNGKRHDAGSLLVILRDTFLAGGQDFTELFVPSDRRVLAGIDHTKHWLVVSQKDNGRPHITLMRPPVDCNASWEWRDFSIPEAGQMSVRAVDGKRDDTVLIQVEHFLTPPTLYHADVANNAPCQLLAQSPAQFNANGMSAVRHHAIAPDGERIPYWLIGHNVETYTAARPCLLYGYGGFEIALDPQYDATTGIAWLERGGLYAVANIRGGGEFGPAWHQAALRKNRQVAFDDFIAVAQELIHSNVTSPKQLAIRGASNGGLLVAACMVQRPDLFGAVLSEMPVLDMARFHLLLQGALWIDEYGDPNKNDDLSNLLSYSPYQNVKADVIYPPALFTSSTSDDRVHPAHARKMVAKMQAQGHSNVWYREVDEGGHGAGVTPVQIARSEAINFEFFRKMIGRLEG